MPDIVGELELDRVGVCVTDAVVDTLLVADSLDVAVSLEDWLLVESCDAVAVADPVSVPVDDCDDVKEVVCEAVTLVDFDWDGVRVRLEDAVIDAVELGLGVIVSEREPVALGVPDCDFDCVTLPVCV